MKHHKTTFSYGWWNIKLGGEILKRMVKFFYIRSVKVFVFVIIIYNFGELYHKFHPIVKLNNHINSTIY